MKSASHQILGQRENESLAHFNFILQALIEILPQGNKIQSTFRSSTGKVLEVLGALYWLQR